MDLEHEPPHLVREDADELAEDLPDLAFDARRRLEQLDLVEEHLREDLDLHDGLEDLRLVVLHDLEDDLERGFSDHLRDVLLEDHERRVADVAQVVDEEVLRDDEVVADDLEHFFAQVHDVLVLLHAVHVEEREEVQLRVEDLRRAVGELLLR